MPRRLPERLDCGQYLVRKGRRYRVHRIGADPKWTDDALYWLEAQAGPAGRYRMPRFVMKRAWTIEELREAGFTLEDPERFVDPDGEGVTG